MNRLITWHFLFAALASALGLAAAATARAAVVDAMITNTAQISTASNNPFFGAGNTSDLVGVNLYMDQQVAPGSSLNGVFFDNVDMGNPPAGVVNLTANSPGITMTVSTPGFRDNSVRFTPSVASGPDAAVLETIAANVSYVAAAGFGVNVEDTFTFSGLGAFRNVYVQTIGGNQGWDGQPLVKANGTTVGVFTSTATNTASIFGFDTTTDASGNLSLDYTTAVGNYGGLAGIIISGEGFSVPEPASLGLLVRSSITSSALCVSGVN